MTDLLTSPGFGAFAFLVVIGAVYLALRNK